MAQNRCGLTLVLAIDVSSSVNAIEYDLQINGLAAALSDFSVRQAIRDVGGVQAMSFEWSGRFQQVDIAPWSLLFSDESIAQFAGRILSHDRGYDDFPTALGYALGYAATRLERAPLRCARTVIDVSGDGVNNDGFEPFSAYANFPFAGVQVNGLVIDGASPDPVSYYRQHVIHGAGAFVEIAQGFSDYEAAMRRKLLREIRGAALSLIQ